MFFKTANSQYFLWKFQARNVFFCVLDLTSDSLTTILMSFASIYPTDPRINPWNFHEKYWELAGLKNSVFFESAILAFFFFIPTKISQSSKDGSIFWWLPWFPAQDNSCLNICNTVYLLNDYPGQKLYWISRWQYLKTAFTIQGKIVSKNYAIAYFYKQESIAVHHRNK